METNVVYHICGIKGVGAEDMPYRLHKVGKYYKFFWNCHCYGNIYPIAYKKLGFAIAKARWAFHYFSHIFSEVYVLKCTIKDGELVEEEKVFNLNIY